MLSYDYMFDQVSYFSPYPEGVSSMMGRTHVILGAAAGLAALPIAQDAWPALLVGGLFGGLLPDMDTTASHLGRRTRPLSTIMCKLFGHRGGTHSLTFMVTMGFLGSLHSDALGIAIALGILSHILADVITFSGKKPYFSVQGAGVQLAWPISSRKIGIRLFQVGGTVERKIVAPAAAVVLACHAQSLMMTYV